MKKNIKKNPLGPIIVLLIMILAISVTSFIMNLIGFSGKITENGTFETSLVTINNVFSKDGLKYIINNAVLNFQMLQPLAYLIISLICVSILKTSGILKHIFLKLKHFKPIYVTFIVFLVGIFSTIIGDYCYLFLMPLTGIMYKYLGRKPSLGILTMFIAITIGYGTGFALNYDQFFLSTITTTNAVIVDKDFIFGISSLSYIMIVSSLIISFVGAIAVEKTVAKKYEIEEYDDHLVTSKKSFMWSSITFAVLSILFIYTIIPGLPGSGILLNEDNTVYIDKLFGTNAPLSNGMLLVFLLISMVCGYVYGKTSKNIKNAHDYSAALTKSFNNTGYIFVLLFFVSLLLSILEWTNIGSVIIVNLFNWIGQLQFAGLLLIIISFIAIVLATIIVPSTIVKWNLIAPVLVPVMMRANITPNYIQMMFQAADSVGKCFSPVYIYFIIYIGLLYRYDNDEHISIFTSLKKVLPVIILLAIAWIVIVLGWYLVSLPLSNGISVTM